MAARRWGPELRSCRFCDAPQCFVYVGGHYQIVKYGVRHYAHPECLARKEGLRHGRTLIPDHQHADYDAAIAKMTDWDRAIAEHADRRGKGAP